MKSEKKHLLNILWIVFKKKKHSIKNKIKVELGMTHKHIQQMVLLFTGIIWPLSWSNSKIWSVNRGTKRHKIKVLWAFKTPQQTSFHDQVRIQLYTMGYVVLKTWKNKRKQTFLLLEGLEKVSLSRSFPAMLLMLVLHFLHRRNMHKTYVG